MLHHIPLQVPLSILLMNLPTLCKSRMVPWSKKVAQHVTICKHQAHFLNPLTALTHGSFFIGSNRFQATGIHVPGELEFLLIHLFIPRPDQFLTLGWVESWTRLELISCDEYVCLFSVRVSWILGYKNTGKLISRRASLGCFSSVEV